MKAFTFPIILLAFLVSCQSEDNAAKVSEEITDMEAQISSQSNFSPESISALVAKYEEYAGLKHADPDKTVDYLLRAGEMASMIGENERALAFYEKIILQFPDHAKAATALFMKGYTLDDKLERLEEAKAVYETFLQKYPDNDFADDTRFLLENLGKSEEEIISKFEQQGEATGEE